MEEAGKTFYVEIRLWANTTVENMRTRLIVHGGHDEQSWVSSTQPETIMTLGPIVFASWYSSQRERFYRAKLDAMRKQTDFSIPESIRQQSIHDAEVEIALEKEKAGRRNRILLEHLTERGYRGNQSIDSMTQFQLGFSELWNNRYDVFEPPILWVVDELEPARVLLTVKCVFDRYHMLAYLAQVLGPLLKNFPTATVEYVQYFGLKELPQELRPYYLDVMREIGGSEQPAFDDIWGYGGRAPVPEGWTRREEPASDSTQPASETTRQSDTPPPWDDIPHQIRLLETTAQGLREMIAPAEAAPAPLASAHELPVERPSHDRSEVQQAIAERRKRVSEKRARGVTVEKIAAEEGKDPKTIYRDIQALKESGHFP